MSITLLGKSAMIHTGTQFPLLLPSLPETGIDRLESPWALEPNVNPASVGNLGSIFPEAAWHFLRGRKFRGRAGGGLEMEEGRDRELLVEQRGSFV